MLQFWACRARRFHFMLWVRWDGSASNCCWLQLVAVHNLFAGLFTIIAALFPTAALP